MQKLIQSAVEKFVARLVVMLMFFISSFLCPIRLLRWQRQSVFRHSICLSICWKDFSRLSQLRLNQKYRMDRLSFR